MDWDGLAERAEAIYVGLDTSCSTQSRNDMSLVSLGGHALVLGMICCRQAPEVCFLKVISLSSRTSKIN